MPNTSDVVIVRFGLSIAQLIDVVGLPQPLPTPLQGSRLASALATVWFPQYGYPILDLELPPPLQRALKGAGWGRGRSPRYKLRGSKQPMCDLQELG